MTSWQGTWRERERDGRYPDPIISPRNGPGGVNYWIPDAKDGVKALQGETSRIDDMEIRQGGQIIPLEVTGTPILDDQGRLQYALAMLRDLGDRQQRSQQQISLQQDLLRRNQELMQENATLKRKLAELQFSPLSQGKK